MKNKLNEHELRKQHVDNLANLNVWFQKDKSKRSNASA
jgi:hypothetical protein